MIWWLESRCSKSHGSCRWWHIRRATDRWFRNDSQFEYDWSPHITQNNGASYCNMKPDCYRCEVSQLGMCITSRIVATRDAEFAPPWWKTRTRTQLKKRLHLSTQAQVFKLFCSSLGTMVLKWTCLFVNWCTQQHTGWFWDRDSLNCCWCILLWYLLHQRHLHVDECTRLQISFTTILKIEYFPTNIGFYPLPI